MMWPVPSQLGVGHLLESATKQYRLPIPATSVTGFAVRMCYNIKKVFKFNVVLFLRELEHLRLRVIYVYWQRPRNEHSRIRMSQCFFLRYGKKVGSLPKDIERE